MSHIKLFIPGPVEVYPDILEEMARPMIGHRSKEFQELYKETTELLQKLLYTKNNVILSTSSATGVWEMCARNLIGKKCLCLVNGAFSERWFETVVQNGKEATKFEVEWGKAIKPEQVEVLLKTGEFDALTLVHNETSTGVMNPLEEIAEVVKKHPGVTFMVDTVSSLAGVKIEVDKLGIDVCLASVQKAFAIPPGLSLFSVSDRAIEKSKTIPDKGYYFNLEVIMKNHLRNMTPSTPPISQIYALNRQLKKIFEEGPEKRFRRHEEMAHYVRDWVKMKFELFPEPGYESVTLTCARNTEEISIASLNERLQACGYTISNGYGALKEKTFRIAHMGDHTMTELKELLSIIEKEMREEK